MPLPTSKATLLNQGCPLDRSEGLYKDLTLPGSHLQIPPIWGKAWASVVTKAPQVILM